MERKKNNEALAVGEATTQVPIREFLTVTEAAEIAGMKRGWMYSHASWLGARKFGRYVRFHRETLIQRLRDGDVPTNKHR